MSKMAVHDEETIAGFDIMTFMTGGTWRENCYLVRDIATNEMAIIDPGEYNGEIGATIRQNGDALRFILLTHAHHDHIGGVAALNRQYGLPCHLHQGDVRLMHHAPMYAWRFAQKRIEKTESFMVFAPETRIYLGGLPIEIIHTPGHTMGSVCYSIDGAVFTGDTLFHQRVGRTDLPGSAADLMQASIDRLMSEAKPEAVIFPGHGKPWTVVEARHWWQSFAPTDKLPDYTEPRE